MTKMNKTNQEPKKLFWKKKVLWGICILLLFAAGAFFGYVNSYYPAEPEAEAALRTDELVSVSGDDVIVFQPEKIPAKKGIIFYPGGKVEEEAYAPLMKRLAAEGYKVFLVSMPVRLAVFDINAADQILEDHPEIEEWYLAGHSLGSSMAAAYAEKHADQLEGLILLAAYSANDLSDTELKVLSLYGGKDGVLNLEKVRENEKNLPAAAETFIIEGGNHAQFGYYGFQKGDGEATISAESQQEETVEKIREFIGKQ